MIFAMFIFLVFWIAYCSQPSKPEKKGILDGINTSSDKDYDPDWIKNYGKPESKLAKPKAGVK